MIAMILVFVPHIGITVHASHRWIGHGALRVQPSEFAKFFTVLFIARSCAGNVRIMKHFVTGPGPGVAATIILAMLTAKEPDLGTALLITFTGAAALFFAGMKWKHMLAMMAVTLTLVGGVLLVKFEHAKTSNDQAGSYQISRILVFLHPETDIQGFGYQVYHSMMGIGSGGLTGRGIGEGREKLNLPEAHTDFIFEVVGEEFGLLGTLTTLGILFIIVARGMHIACTTRDRFGSLLAAGLSFSLGIQAAVNIGVATGAIPNTGVPLPFVSYGGSSLLMSLVMVGILLNIGKNPDGDPNIVRVQPNQRLDRDFSRRWQTNGALPRRQPNAEQNPYCKPAAG
jgi:cell division protein FtsW